MIVILQKMSKLLLLLSLIAMSILTHAQDCNRETKYKTDMKFIPKEVCIQNGKCISYIHSKHYKTDFNNDGLSDFVFDIDNKEIRIGDTTQLVFYVQNSDSTFSLYKSFDNLYPVYQGNNEHDFKNAPLNIENFFNECYMGEYHVLYFLTVVNDRVAISRHYIGWPRAYFFYSFRFDPNIGDWKLIKKELVRPDETRRQLTIKDTLLLSRFSYCEEIQIDVYGMEY